MAYSSELETRLERFGLTPHGRAWVVRALHPAGETACDGVPDESTAYVVRPEYRIQHVVTPPPGGANWDLLILALPGDVNGVMWFAAPSPADFLVGAVPANATYGVIQTQPATDRTGGQVWRTFPPVPDFSASIQSATALPHAFRHVYKSITCYLTAAAVADQGTIYAAQVQPIRRLGPVTTTASINAATGNANCGQHVRFRVPLSEDELLALCPEAYTAPARQGCYMPLRITGPTMPFAHCAVSPNLLYGGFGGVPYVPLDPISLVEYPSLPGFTINDTGASTGPLTWISTYPNNLIPTTGPGYGFDTGYDNTSVGVVIFRGLAGGGGGLGASVTIKVIEGLEVIPRPLSPDRVFARAPAPFDPKALECYFALCAELKDAYPSSYNFLGSIMSVLGSVAAKVWPVVRAGLGAAAQSAFGGGGGVGQVVVPAPAPQRPRLVYVDDERPVRQASVVRKKTKPLKKRGSARK